jgi:hypothetical protein
VTERVSVQALRELAQKATPSPWQIAQSEVIGIVQREDREEGIWYGRDLVECVGDEDDPQAVADAYFIAACDPQTVLALLDVAEAAYVFLNAENNDPRIEGYFKALGEALQKVEL